MNKKTRIYLEKKTENNKNNRHTKCSKKSNPNLKYTLLAHKN